MMYIFVSVIIAIKCKELINYGKKLYLFVTIIDKL